MVIASRFCSFLDSQNINPIIQSSMRIGRKTIQKANFKTRPTPMVTELTRKIIPMIINTGIRRMPNISLCITSDTSYLGVSIININYLGVRSSMQTSKLTLITVPLCPKCKIMRQRLGKLSEGHPGLVVEEMGLSSYLGEALKRRIMDAPIILAGDDVLTGIVDDSTILKTLGLLA